MKENFKDHQFVNGVLHCHNELLNSHNEPCIILDRNYLIIAANAAYKNLHNFKIDNKSHCYEISHHNNKPCDQEGESCPLKLCLENNSAQRTLHIHQTKDGAAHFDVHLSPIHDDSGEIKYFLESIKPVKCASTHPKARGLVGRSIAFNTVIEMVQRVACSDVSVLLQGESGTGKELIAEAIHHTSKRSKGPFVTVDCSGLAETLFESELFGHEKGAFTGAQTRKIGLAEAANGGTLFLDETGDISLSLQTKLLRLIETGTFRRVGGIKTLKTDFRLISASHKNLRMMVENEEFRNDLYYRISAFPLHIPSLKERIEDIPLLVDSILKRFYPEINVTISKEAIHCLQQYTFPGNIRELGNIIQRAALMADDNKIKFQHLPNECKSLLNDEKNKTCFSELTTLKAIEKRYIKWASTQIKNNSKLARKLGISERTLYRKLESQE